MLSRGLTPRTMLKMPASLLAVAFFSSLLVSRSGSSMRKSFVLCEAFGLTPFRAQPPDPTGALRGA